MAFNSIGQTTSYSGADITVVAYRSIKSPAERFKIDDTKKKIKKAETNYNQALTEINSREEELTRKVSGLQTQEARLLQQLRSSGIPKDSTSWKTIEGKAQNKAEERSRAQKELDGINYEPLDAATEELNNLIIDSGLGDDATIFNLGTIHTVSYSSFREKFAVRSLGKTQAKAYTRGPRTIAGTMVFNVVQEHELLRLLGQSKNTVGDGFSYNPIDNTSTEHPAAVMLDQIQPFNLLFLFANEFGAYSSLHLFNIDLSSEGQEMSVDSIVTHNAMNFYATDMVPMRSLGSSWFSTTEMINGEVGRGIVGLAESSSSLRVAEKNNLNSKRKTSSINDLLLQSRGLF